MNPSSFGNEETPVRPSTAGAQSPGQSSPPDEENPSDRGRFSFLASLLLIAIAFCVGLSYLLEKRWVQERAAKVETTAPAETTAKAAAPLNPDLFQISEIALGAPRTATINGKRLSEGESLAVQSEGGLTNVKITRIEAAGVELTDGTHSIKVNASPSVVQQATP